MKNNKNNQNNSVISDSHRFNSDMTGQKPEASFAEISPSNGKSPGIVCSALLGSVFNNPENFIKRYGNTGYPAHKIKYLRDDLMDCLQKYGLDSDEYKRESARIAQSVSNNILILLDLAVLTVGSESNDMCHCPTQTDSNTSIR